MQDKDFDQLFKNSFENFEAEPGANTWDKIEQRMGREPKRKVPGYRWMAAASVVIIAAAALMLMNTADTEPMKLTGKPKVKPTETIDSGSNVIQDVSPVESTAIVAADHKQVASVPSAGTKNTQRAANQEVISNGPVRRETEAKTLLVQAPQQQVPINKQPVVTIPVMEAEMAIASAEDNATQQAASLAEIAQDNQNEGKRRPFSVGRLVNSIVAKVDNREDKVIEFRDEDDTSVLSGINLGFLKIKKNK